MELIERYLQAVGRALPKAQREDIVRELRDSILSQVEEQEESLGRPLNEAEQVEVLEKLGSPARLAGRYRKQEHVIGSTVFPIYWKVLKLALGLAFLVLAVGSIALAAAGKPLLDSLGVLLRYPNVALSVFGWVTLTFAALEFFGAKYKGCDRFDPRKLPPLEKTPSSGKSQFELIASLVAQIVFGVWWLVGLHYPFLVLGPGAALLRFGPIWYSLYPLFVFMVVFDGFRHTMKIVRPQWNGHRVLSLIMSALGFIVLYFLIMTPEPFVATNPDSAPLQGLVKNLNFGLHLGLTVAIVIKAILFVVDAAKLVGRKLSQAQQTTMSW
jgi:hypothetical protein